MKILFLHLKNANKNIQKYETTHTIRCHTEMILPTSKILFFCGEPVRCLTRKPDGKPLQCSIKVQPPPIIQREGMRPKRKKPPRRTPWENQGGVYHGSEFCTHPSLEHKTGGEIPVKKALHWPRLEGSIGMVRGGWRRRCGRSHHQQL